MIRILTNNKIKSLVSKAGEAFRRQLADLQSLAKRAAGKPLRLAPAVFERKSFAWREAMADGMDG